MKFLFSLAVVCVIVVLHLYLIPAVEFLVTRSWTLAKYAFSLVINFMVLLFLSSFVLSIFWSIQFVCKQISLFRAERNNIELDQAVNDAIWMDEMPPEVPGQSGDHQEFFDIPELIDTEHAVNRENRRRRQRMVSTLLHDNSRDPSRDRRRSTIEESLRESEDFDFRTPFPSPRPAQADQNSLSVISEHHLDFLLDKPESNKNLTLEKSYSSSQVIEVDPINETLSRPHIEKHEAALIIPSKPILHQFPRGMNKPSLSCDGMFLETYIRLIGIGCDVAMDCVDTNGPWIQSCNKKVFGVKDCIQYIKDAYPDTSGLFTVSGDRRGASWSLTLLVDHLYWGLMCWRWVVEDAKEFILNQPGWNRICRNQEESIKSVKDTLWAVGFGKMSYQGVTDVIVKDLETLAEILDVKSFLLGETPTEIDCYAFSVLCQIEWGEESVLRDRLRDSINVQNYCIRLRNLLWPDWDAELAIVDKNKSPSRVFAAENNIPEDEHGTSCKRKPSKTHFTKSYYQLLPAEEAISENETEDIKNMPAFRPYDDDLIYICTRSTTTEVTTIQKSSGRRQYTDDHDRAIQMMRDGDVIHSYGVEEYFEDGFQDMEGISFLANESVRNGESLLSPRDRLQ